MKAMFQMVKRLGMCAAAVLSTACAAAAEFGDNVHLRGDFQNARIAFEREGRGTVAFLGGSITEMNGYRPLVCEILQRRFPKTVFKFVDAGISSTCSTTGAFRLGTDVLGQGPVDLLFVEFAVNDDQDAHHTRDACIRGMEGIIRHARQAYPDMDIVMTFFLNEGMLSTLRKGETPLTVAAHTAVAEAYAVPTIHLAKEVAARITAGTLTWQQYGGVHPSLQGNTLCARMIDELFNRAWSAPLPKEVAKTPCLVPLTPLDPLNYAAGRFIDPATAKVKQGWTLGVPDWQSIPGSKRARFTALPMLCAETPGAELTLTFEGRAVGAYVVAGPDAGIVEASIDGGSFRQVELYHAYSKGLHYPRTVMFTVDAAEGAHTLTLRVSGETRAGGHAARIIQFVAN
jgi:lysophospholipase L1-like esterase